MKHWLLLLISLALPSCHVDAIVSWSVTIDGKPSKCIEADISYITVNDSEEVFCENRGLLVEDSATFVLTPWLFRGAPIGPVLIVEKREATFAFQRTVPMVDASVAVDEFEVDARSDSDSYSRSYARIPRGESVLLPAWTGLTLRVTGYRGGDPCFQRTVEVGVVPPVLNLTVDEVACKSSELCGADGTGDGIDDDADGIVDNGCSCTPGDVRSCFGGPKLNRGVGSCTDGTMVCIADALGGHWGDCTGDIVPTVEACNARDDNCDGTADEGMPRCAPALACPDSSALPPGTPFTPYTIDAAPWVPVAAVQSWSWTVTGGPCDQLHQQTVGQTSFSISGADTPILTIHPTLSGDYTVRLVVTLAGGEQIECTFVVRIAGPGLRVELCWDKTGTTDIDLHLHRPGSTTPWVLSGAASAPDECYFGNCSPNFGVVRPNWGHAPSPLDACGGPTGRWASVGSCPNPRLDIDNIGTPGLPENINIDVPTSEAAYRVMVHYFGGVGVVKPMVEIWCGGKLVSVRGSPADPVPGFTTSGGPEGGHLWRVADVVHHADGTCTVSALHPAGQTTGYDVRLDDLSY